MVYYNCILSKTNIIFSMPATKKGRSTNKCETASFIDKQGLKHFTCDFMYRTCFTHGIVV